jgi:tetratricopeptide (TPR) repeat protein
MKTSLKATGAFFFSLLCAIGFSQNVEFEKDNFPNDKAGLKEAKKNMETGDVYFDKSFAPKSYYDLYHSAIPYYIKANDFNPNNAMLNYRLGVSYLNSAYKTKALAHLEKAYKLNPNVG